jgi:hypothetical protein
MIFILGLAAEKEICSGVSKVYIYVEREIITVYVTLRSKW